MVKALEMPSNNGIHLGQTTASKNLLVSARPRVCFQQTGFIFRMVIRRMMPRELSVFDHHEVIMPFAGRRV